MERSCKIVVRLLLSIDRRTSIEDAWDTLSLAQDLRKTNEDYARIIVGLDLSGDPNVNSVEHFLLM